MAVRALCGSLLSGLASPLRLPWTRSSCLPVQESWWGVLDVCSGSVGGLVSGGVPVRCVATRNNRSTGPRQNKPRRHWITPDLPRGVDERLSDESLGFLQQMVHEKYASPLRVPPPERAEYTRYTRRCGLLCRKLGVMPQWTKAGKKVITTLLQVVDNHVVNMSPSSQFGTTIRGKHYNASRNRLSSLVVGAESIDPTHLTDEYCQLFEPAGLQPKRKLSKMIVSDNAIIPPGTPLRATHFRVGDYVDVGGRTVDYGFQGVVKRWGFKGGPASHGATKQHRRTGSIGFSRHHGRVMKGKKMPGHMGNAYRVTRGLKVLRMNTKLDVLYVKGNGVPGLTNSWCMVWDTELPTKRCLKNPPPMPTHYPEDEATPLPEEIVHPDLHVWDEPTLVFQVTDDDLKAKVRTGAKTALKAGPKAPAAKGQAAPAAAAAPPKAAKK